MTAAPAEVEFLRHDGVIAMAHRGFSPEGYENTMAAFAAAVELGYRYLETDAHATRDGVLLAFHDKQLHRVTNGRGRVADLTWREVRDMRIRGVEPIPRLDDVLEAFPHARLNVDVKHPAAVEPLARLLAEPETRARVLVASFSEARRRAVLDRVPGPVATSAGPRGIARFLLAALLRGDAAVLRRAAGDVHCLQLPTTAGPLRLVTRRTVQAAHAAGLQLHVWTVNEEPEMRALLDLGVDGIVTDRADVLRAVLLERGQWQG